ncbi:hypothetical protein KAR91_67395 [Candidatus Pacearchaeota archaeon]|nr:hypothetical protein [Candidatus Pacearchaeota archaeon]
MMNTYNQIKEQAESLIIISFRMGNPEVQSEARKIAENLLKIVNLIKLEDEALDLAINEVREAVKAISL